MRGRFGRRRTFGKSIALVIGAVALIVLIAKRRAADDQQAERAKQAAKEAADAIRESYRTARGRFVEAQERQTRYATDFSERVSDSLRAGTESARAASQELTEQAQKRVSEEAGEVHTQGVEETERSVREDIGSIIRESVRRSRVRSSREASETGGREEPQAGTTAPETRVDVEEIPIQDYDSLNVHQVTQRLGELSVEEIERLRDYEAKNKNRRSLIKRFETRIRAAREGRSSS